MKIKNLCLGLWICVLGASLAGAQVTRETAPLATRITRQVVVPAEVGSHGMFVRVTINGHGPYRMLVDTGCTFSMISPEVEAQLQASGFEPESDDVRAVNGLGDAVSMPRVLLDTVDLGGVRFEGIVAGVVPLDLQSKIEGQPMDGIIGYSLFAGLYFALDFPNHRLVLSQDWPQNLPPVRTQLPIFEHSGVPFVPVQIQGQSFEVMIDSGANDRFHLPPESTQSLAWTVAPRPGFLLAVAGETSREQIARLSGSLQLGGLHEDEPVVGISPGPPTIGMALLRPYCVVFQPAEEKIWFCSAQGNAMPSPPVRTVGLSLIGDGQGNWTVAGTIPNSPAEQAGIQQGDLVTRVEGQPAQNWTPDELQDWVESHAALAVRVAGAIGERDLNLPVWVMVP